MLLIIACLWDQQKPESTLIIMENLKASQVLQTIILNSGHSRFLIQGPPGCGKSTWLEHQFRGRKGVMFYKVDWYEEIIKGEEQYRWKGFD